MNPGDMPRDAGGDSARPEASPDDLIDLLNQLRDALTHLSLSLSDLRSETDASAMLQSFESMNASLARIGAPLRSEHVPRPD